MYWNGQITRFVPECIRTLFPKLFDMEFGDNQDFVDSTKEIDGYIEFMKGKLVDRRFDAFRDTFK